jgi:hypothetical protein
MKAIGAFQAQRLAVGFKSLVLGKAFHEIRPVDNANISMPAFHDISPSLQETNILGN